MNYKARAVIFDMDGTLLDTLQDLADAVNAALGAKGFPDHPVDAYRVFVGDGVETLIRRACPESADDAARRAVLLGMRDTYAKNWMQYSRPYPGIEELVAALKERGIPMAVLSNKPHEFTLLMARHFFPDEPFARVQGSPAGEKAKPEPTLALRVANDLGVAPEDVLFVGDSNIDMITAKAAGMTSAGASWGFRPVEELIAHGAAYILDTPQDILRYV